MVSRPVVDGRVGSMVGLVEDVLGLRMDHNGGWLQFRAKDSPLDVIDSQSFPSWHKEQLGVIYRRQGDTRATYATLNEDPQPKIAGGRTTAPTPSDG